MKHVVFYAISAVQGQDLKSVKLVSLQHFHGLVDKILAPYLAVLYFKAYNTSFAV